MTAEVRLPYIVVPGIDLVASRHGRVAAAGSFHEMGPFPQSLGCFTSLS